jgi:Cof subfamily protein (haloacid dehalogenase superfamily)
MYKLVAIDLDGTLLNSKSEISHENMEAISKAISKGIKIVICSGRIFAGARVFARELGLKGPVITCNGAVIRDAVSGATLYESNMSLEDCCRIIDTCRREKVYFHVYAGDTMYAEELKYGSEFYWRINKRLPESDRIDIKVVDSVAEALKRGAKPPSKIVAITEDRRHLAHVRKQISRISTVEIMSSYSNNFEVANHGVNKGNALKFFSDAFDVPAQQMIAIGDNENDYSMIKFAGLGVAMGNAEEFIKNIADYVTATNDEDGVAKVLNEFVI